MRYFLMGVLSFFLVTAILQAATPKTEHYLVRRVLPMDNALIAQIQTAIQNGICPEVDTEYGLSGATACTVPRDLNKIGIRWHYDDDGVEKAYIYVYFDLPGHWTAGDE